MKKRTVSALLLALLLCGSTVTLVGCKSGEDATGKTVPGVPPPPPSRANEPDKQPGMMPDGGPPAQPAAPK